MSLRGKIAEIHVENADIKQMIEKVKKESCDCYAECRKILSSFKDMFDAYEKKHNEDVDYLTKLVYEEMSKKMDKVVEIVEEPVIEKIDAEVVVDEVVEVVDEVVEVVDEVVVDN
jgi:transketolase